MLPLLVLSSVYHTVVIVDKILISLKVCVRYSFQWNVVTQLNNDVVAAERALKKCAHAHKCCCTTTTTTTTARRSSDSELNCCCHRASKPRMTQCEREKKFWRKKKFWKILFSFLVRLSNSEEIFQVLTFCSKIEEEKNCFKKKIVKPELIKNEFHPGHFDDDRNNLLQGHQQ